MGFSVGGRQQVLFVLIKDKARDKFYKYGGIKAGKSKEVFEILFPAFKVVYEEKI